MKFFVKLACISLLFVSLLIVQSSNVEAAFPGYNGKISFDSSRDGNGEIFAMDLNGNNLVNLSNFDASDGNSDWSPDGKKIVFHSNREGNFEIYSMNADGSGLNRLTNDPGDDMYPSWSADGTKIAFRTNRDGGNQEIYVMNADGSNLINLTNNPGVDTVPSWSPDGTKIVYRSGGFGASNFREIYVMNADGSDKVQLTNNSSADDNPRWSPDGLMIAFTSSRDGNDEVYIMNHDGTNQVNLSNHPESDARPTFSPDGTKLLFKSNRDGNDEVYIMNLDGTNQINVTQNSASDSAPAWQPIPNKKPTTTNDATTVSFNGTKSINVLTNDTDEEALDAQYLTIKTHPSYGSASIVDGKVRYTPKKDFVGSDKLTYQICDSFLLDQKCATGVLSVTVNPGSKPPAPKINKVGTVELNGSDKVYYTSNKPTFSGKAEPFATVKIEIHSDPIILTTTADEYGNWSVTPEVDIPNGEHTVKITATKDGATSDPISFVLGINVGLAETGSPLWPITLIGFVGALGIVSGKYLRKRVAE